ncbi:MMPL family transporter [Pseudofrankia inefficax]|uniref:MmpL domain-containing protein n=1 Tax=Pseudofrankia inefficax (strain DSM 45817 / CECT 9037 / DDB 130130 / EuI1c) TaxID=298654 RepID=E3J4B1_PSEI1|nr:MMPL family transporter [Pseudofrankia inefficax]ADP83030.1 MmpL domain-containing protein [Pseudofrankia inefficax]
MATYLYRLGRAAYRRRRLVVALWVLLLALAGVGAATLSGSTSDALSIPGTESQKAIDLLNGRMPGAGADTAAARVVFTLPAGSTGSLADPARQGAIEQAVQDLSHAPLVGRVTDPFTTVGGKWAAVSEDGRTAYASVNYTVQERDVTDAARNALFAAAGPARSAGLGVEFGGSATAGSAAQSATEVIGIAVAAVVLLITFGSFLAAGLPLLSALLGVAIGVCGISVATGFLHLSSSTSTLALMIGLAVGIDYALFITSRFRHELAAGEDGEQAAGRAVGTAGSAVVFAGLTVVIALAALTVAGIPFLTQMGLAAAGTVAIAVAIALTLLPAVFGFAGRRLAAAGPADGAASPARRRGRHLSRRFAGLRSRDPEADGNRPTMGERWARLAVRRRGWVVAAAVLGLGLVAAPVTSLRLGLPDDSTAAPSSTQRIAYDQLSNGFGAGFNGPLLLVVDLAHAGDRTAAVAKVAATIRALPDVTSVGPATFNKARDTATFSVTPGSGPSEAATEHLVHTIRSQAGALTAATGAVAMVTGTTAVNIDISEKLSAALIPYLAVVVGLAFVLLLLVFRSVLVPLKATLGFLLSVVATFGAVVAVFQWGWLKDLFGVSSTGPIVSMLPIFLVGVLFGLAMDYEVFLVTRMREEYVHGRGPDDAVTVGFRHGARVVTAAAIIMISVFAGFILSSEPIIQSVGFALAFGVLVDAFVVRMTLVPAVMSLLGRRAWWLPSWLDRRLPDIDVEGKRLDGPAALGPDAAGQPDAVATGTARETDGGLPSQRRATSGITIR